VHDGYGTSADSVGGVQCMPMDIRVGHGYDLHLLSSPKEGGKPMVLGGVPIESSVGPIAHSDGDAVLHAVTDAILSAIGSQDIGQLFPDTADENKNRPSSEFLVEAIDRVNSGGWAIGNVDVTVICDEPKIGPHKERILTSLRTLIGAPVNIKGKTHEETGRGGAIEVHAIALVQRGTHQ